MLRSKFYHQTFYETVKSAQSKIEKSTAKIKALRWQTQQQHNLFYFCMSLGSFFRISFYYPPISGLKIIKVNHFFIVLHNYYKLL